jgi:hypothetical protein
VANRIYPGARQQSKQTGLLGASSTLVFWLCHPALNQAAVMVVLNACRSEWSTSILSMVVLNGCSILQHASNF